MTIYVAGNGYYSDFSVVGVFSTREKAAAAGEHVLEFELDRYSDLEFKLHVYFCRADRDGRIIEEARIEPRWDDPGKRGFAKAHARSIIAISYVSAEHACKLMAEKRQELLYRASLAPYGK